MGVSQFCGTSRQWHITQSLKKQQQQNNKSWRNLKCKLLSETSQCEQLLFYDSNDMAFWKRENYGVSKMISGYHGLGGETNRWTREFLGQFLGNYLV